MKIGGKEILAILAILIIIAMSFQGSQESQVIVLDRQPEYIPTPVFIGGGPRFPPRRPPRPRPRPRPRHAHAHAHTAALKLFPLNPLRFPKSQFFLLSPLNLLKSTKILSLVVATEVDIPKTHTPDSK